MVAAGRTIAPAFRLTSFVGPLVDAQPVVLFGRASGGLAWGGSDFILSGDTLLKNSCVIETMKEGLSCLQWMLK